MINYSIVMRPVNSNLLEINQAKGRINAAKVAGEEPSEADLAIVATEKTNAFAVAQYADVMTIEKFARHISTHGCVYSRADISAILYMAVDCMREQLLEGKKIRLGDLGDFSVSLTSKGAESAEKFSAQNITDVKVQWEPGAEFKTLKSDAEFNLVASRKAQQAVIAAIKAGETTVDLSTVGQQTADNGQQTPSGDDPDDNGGGSPTPTPKAKYTLTVNSADTSKGTVTGGGEYEEGTEVTLKATAKSGYQFQKWNDGNTSATRKVTVSANAEYTAQFEEQSSTPPSI